MITLTDDERDAVTELLNIGVGRAAAAFSRMIGEEIRMSVPSIEVCGGVDAAALLRERLPGALGGVVQTFDGLFNGVAALIFPERQSLQIVRTILNRGDYPLEEISELERETFLEIGNIVLNHCLGTVSNTLGLGCRSSLPRALFDGEEGVFVANGLNTEGLVLFLHITFAVQSIDARGYLAFLLDMDGAGVFLAHVQDYIAKLTSG